MNIRLYIRKGVEYSRGALAVQGRPLYATFVALLILSLPFIFRPYVITGGSMEPTYSEGAIVLAEKLTYRFHISRGEIIVMRNPHDKRVVEIKRVIGLPGETVEMGGEGVVINPDCVQGAPLYGGDGTEGDCRLVFAEGTLVGGTGNGTFRIKLGPEDYFVLGDNRSKSSDSRTFGAVQKVDVIGHVVLKLWSAH